MEFMKDYMGNPEYRQKLNVLTKNVFGFDFEDWVTNGYYEGDYIPYSFLENGRMISNASVNRMKFMQNGKEKYYIQIGTVMTENAYRRKGYARELIKRIFADYQANCDGIYLFANLEAVGFYEKFGFQPLMEFRYTLKSDVISRRGRVDEKEKTKGSTEFQKVDSTDNGGKKRYINTVRNSAVQSALEQTNKFGLQLFYTADMENVYYSKELDCYVVFFVEDDTLYLQSIICENPISLKAVIPVLLSSNQVKQLVLGFTPYLEDTMLFNSELYNGGDDYRLLYIGDEMQAIQKEQLYFPKFSHA